MACHITCGQAQIAAPDPVGYAVSGMIACHDPAALTRGAVDFMAMFCHLSCHSLVLPFTLVVKRIEMRNKGAE